MYRKTGLLIIVTCAAALAVSSTATAATQTVYAGQPPGTKALVVKLLGKGAKALGQTSPGINAFFKQKVTIHAGDSVKWVGLVSGFHTIDIPAKGGEDLPLIVGGAKVTGVNDAAGNPFWFNGVVPNLAFNTQLLGPTGGTTYNGSSRVDSGLAAGPHPSDTLKVKFTKPGVYRYFCDVHPGMIGYVDVRAKGKPVPTRKQNKVAITKALTKDILAAAKLLKVKQPADSVSLGESTPGGVELYAMFPSSLTVKAGTVVTFSMSAHTREVHTASFGPSDYLGTLAASVQSPAFDQQVFYPSSPGVIQFSPTSHGNGFANTGGLDRDSTTPLPTSDKIDFTTAGTYHFECLIHPFMTGTIIVK